MHTHAAALFSRINQCSPGLPGERSRGCPSRPDSSPGNVAWPRPRPGIARDNCPVWCQKHPARGAQAWGFCLGGNALSPGELQGDLERLRVLPTLQPSPKCPGLSSPERCSPWRPEVDDRSLPRLSQKPSTHLPLWSGSSGTAAAPSSALPQRENGNIPAGAALLSPPRLSLFPTPEPLPLSLTLGALCKCKGCDFPSPCSKRTAPCLL